MKHEYKNPYPDLTDDVSKRINTEIHINDWSLLRTCRLFAGTFNITTNILISKLCHELRSRGIVDATRCDEYESFVAGCKLVASDEYESLVNDATQWRQSQVSNGRPNNSPAVRSPRRTDGGTQRRATKGEGKNHPAKPQVPSDVQGDSGSGGQAAA